MLLFKYGCMLFFIFGIFIFSFYIYLCNLLDKIWTYIDNRLYKIEKEYDYIVVGAGSAGSVIAARLSEDPDVSVLVLEAGGYGNFMYDIPIVSPLLHRTIYDWQYQTTPQEHACQALQNNMNYWPAGKLIGGSGRLNNMLYVRGHRDDFKDWYQYADDYNYERDILQYFKKAENQQGIYLNDTKYHSTNGPLNAVDLPFVSGLYLAAEEVAASMGFPIRDINGEFSTGFAQPQVNLKNGGRFSTGHYLLQRRRRPNLFIKVYSHVEKVLFKDNYEAYAVKHRIFDDVYITRARRAIILSASAVGSPKILMQSGVGVRAHLEEIGIKVTKELPVGNNLQDHIGTGGDLVLMDHPLEINFRSVCSLESYYEYFVKSRGYLTSTGCEAFLFLNSKCLDRGEYELCDKTAGRPDLEFIFVPSAMAGDEGFLFRHIYNLKEETWNGYFSKFVDNYPISIMPVLLHPKSSGTIRLKDKNPYSKPVIDPNYLSDPSDVDMLVKGLKFMKKFVESPPMRKLGARFNYERFPGCESFRFASDEYWKCYVRRITFTIYHPVGTCKMGPEKDPTSVVDYDFKVIGLNKLFVADASVMPTLVSANTNAAVVMIAEKVADVLKSYRRLEKGVCHIKEVFFKNMFCNKK